MALEVVDKKRGKPECPKKNLGAKEKTDNKFNRPIHGDDARI